MDNEEYDPKCKETQYFNPKCNDPSLCQALNANINLETHWQMTPIPNVVSIAEQDK